MRISTEVDIWIILNLGKDYATGEQLVYAQSAIRLRLSTHAAADSSSTSCCMCYPVDTWTEDVCVAASAYSHNAAVLVVRSKAVGVYKDDNKTGCLGKPSVTPRLSQRGNEASEDTT